MVCCLSWMRIFLTLEENILTASTQHNAQEKIWMYEIESEIRFETIT
jgi:hypothetical protein